MYKLLTVLGLASCSLYGAGPTGSQTAIQATLNKSQSRIASAEAIPVNNPVNPTPVVPTQIPAPRNGATGPTGLPNNPSIDPRSPIANAEVEAQMNKALANGKATQDTAATFKDAEINKKIRAKINSWYADDYKGIIINTSNGVVTIVGIAAKPEIASDLAEQVRKIDGVSEVNNNVKVDNTK